MQGVVRSIRTRPTRKETEMFKNLKDLPESVKENIATLLEKGDFKRGPLGNGLRCPLPIYSSSRVLRENIDKIIPVQKLPEGALPSFDRT